MNLLAHAKNSFLTLIFLSLCFSIVSVLAQDKFSDEPPREPIKNDCLKPNSGEKECIPQPPNIEIKNLICNAEKLGFVTFELCNIESEPVVALEIDPSGKNFMQQIEPRLPLTIEPEMCVDITVEGIERRDTIESCDIKGTFCLKVYADKKPGFDCSGNYGFGYNFTSDLEYLKGMSGIVSLYNPKPREEENDQ